MTKESRTKFEWESGSGEASVNLSTLPGDGTIIHDSFTNYGERKHVCQNMPVQIAREMAQWILDNTEPPEPTLQEQFDALEVGDKFVLEGSIYLREKVDAYRYINLTLAAQNPGREQPRGVLGAHSPERRLTKV